MVLRFQNLKLAPMAATQPWLVVEYLPSSAPELNPVEGLWATLKGRELANRLLFERMTLGSLCDLKVMTSRDARVPRTPQ